MAKTLPRMRVLPANEVRAAKPSVKNALGEETSVAGQKSVQRGPGRPQGPAPMLVDKLVREAAMMTGELPHEFLLRVSRGDAIQQMVKVRDPGPVPQDGEPTYHYEQQTIYPDFPTRIEVAKACANYFAAKLSTVEVVQKASDDELDAFIQHTAAEAGISLGAAGEGAPEGSDAPTRGIPEQWPPAQVH